MVALLDSLSRSIRNTGPSTHIEPDRRDQLKIGTSTGLTTQSQPSKKRPGHFPITPHLPPSIPFIPRAENDFDVGSVQINSSARTDTDPFAKVTSYAPVEPVVSIYDKFKSSAPPTLTSPPPPKHSTSPVRDPPPPVPRKHAHRREYSVGTVAKQTVVITATDDPSHKSTHSKVNTATSDHSKRPTRKASKDTLRQGNTSTTHRAKEKPVIPIVVATQPTPPKALHSASVDTLIPTPSTVRPYVQSRSSSFADVSRPSSPEGADSPLFDFSIPVPALPTHISRNRPSSMSRSTSANRPSPLNPNASVDTGYDTSSTTGKSESRRHRSRPQRSHDILEEMPELHEDYDTLRGMRGDAGVLASLAAGGTNLSTASFGSKVKADKVLGLDPHAKLASFYLVSGLPKNLPEWSFADTEATRGVHFAEDSMEMFWRPDILGSCFSGQQTEDWMRSQARARKESKASSSNYKPDASMINGIRGVHVPDAGPDGPRKLITKTLKFAHPRDIEVINSSLNPPTTCHAFTFTLPKHDTLATIARTRLDSSVPHRSHSHVKYNSITSTQEDTHMSVHDSAPPSNVRNMSSATELTFYGVTMTVWTYAGHERSIALKKLKEHRERVKNGTMDSLRSDPQQILTKMSTSSSQYTHGKSKTQNNGKKPRTSMPWGMSRGLSDGEVTASETEAGVSDSDFDGPLGRRAMFRGVSAALDSRGSGIDSLPEDAAVVFDDAGDCFFVPYAITLVSRHPIYDVMQDFLRLSWARYSKNAKQHMTQVCRMLNHETPRPGELYRLPLTVGSDEPVSIEATMPGALDFERGIVKVDFQLWPLFQALDVDHILTCVEVALSNTGRIVFCSKHPAMLNVAVNTLKYIVELRGWNGIAVPMIHARDMTFVIEDPGPYIIGMSSECKYMVTMPSEVVVVDIDTNSLSCKSPPVGVITPRPRREKAKQKVFAALGQEYPLDRTIPIELKISYPKSSFRNLNKFIHGPERPSYLGERLRLPSWWHHTEVITAFDKIMLNKHKKPSLIQRLTKSGMARQQAQLTVGEQLARTMMRRRALHYVETRDDLELKIGKINKKLLKLTQEGEHWRKQFESFERYADKLTSEANDLKIKIEREKREAKRLSNIASEQTKANEELEEKLKNTETARAEAMRQLSDMHHSIQELEKEREEIMDMFETQINHALEGLPIGTDAGSRPSTPSGSTISSPRLTHRVRPGTSDTQRSTLSRLTTDSRAISVIGAATGAGETPLRKKVVRPGTAGTVSTEMAERNLGHKTDQMSLRIASIQAKLEMALSTITAPHESSVAESQSQYSGDHTDDLTDGDDVREGLGLHNVQAHRSADSGGLTEASDAETEEDSAVVATPTASRRPSKSTGLGSAQAADAPPVPRRGSAAKADESPTLKSDKQLEDDVNNDRPLSPEYHSAVETVSPEHDTTNRQSILSEDGSIVASDNSMTPTKYPIVQRARTPSGVNGNGEGGIGIIKRGVSLRIKKKDGDSSKSGTPPRSRNASRPTSALGHRDRDHGTEEKRISSQHQRQNQGDDQDDGSYDHPMDDKDNGHVKLSTEDSVRSTMMLISPSNSVDGIDRGVGGGVKILNHGSREHELGVEVTDGDELEQEFGEDNKRLSMMSNSTVAFGQMT